MKNRKRKLAVITVACCTTVFLLGPVYPVHAVGTMNVFDNAVAGITLSMDNYYKNTTDSNLIEDAKNKTKVKIEEGAIGIADVADYLNIRKSANEKSDVVGLLPKNGGCYIYSVESNGWAKIKSGKIVGYVNSRFLVTGRDVTALAKKVGAKVASVTASKVNIHSKKDVDSSSITTVPKGEQLEVLDDSDKEWIYVRIDSDKGYISKEYADVTYQLAKAVKTEEEAMETLASTSSNQSLRSMMVSYAKKFLGGKYVYGGTSLTKGIDCSAFMMRIYQHFGYNISRTSRSQAADGKEIKLKQVMPGDLVFYDRNGTISHVAMYIGNGKIIHASNRISGIKISNMYYKAPCKAVRFLED